MMLRCLAVDDELLALELLADNILKVPYLELVATCSNALQAMEVLKDNEIDLIFSDIRMPALDGLQLIGSLPRKPMVIFVTAYENYAVKSFEIDVVDYLVKPVAFDRFLLAANKALMLHNLKATEKRIGPDRGGGGHIFINLDYGFVKLLFNDVLYVEALKDYVKIYLVSSKKTIVARMTLKAAEELLPKNTFSRIHKSYIVAQAAITVIKKQSIFLGDVELPIGETFKEKIDNIVGKRT